MLGKRKGMIALAVILGLMLVVLMACAGEEEEATPTAAVETATVAPGETPSATEAPAPTEEEPMYGGMLRYLTSADLPHWDFQTTVSYQTMGHSSFVHSKLMTFPFGPDEDPADYTPQPSLAESWEISDDGLSVTFHLRKGVKWQDKPPVNGREFVAEDVKFTWERLVRIKSPNLWQFAAVESIECPDNYTVVMNLNAPMASLLTNLADVWSWIFPHEVEEEYGGMEKYEYVVGLGPYTVRSYQPGVGTEFEKNPDYWGTDKEGRQLPYLDEILYTIVVDTSTRLAALRAGNTDVTLSISHEDWDSVKETNPELIWTKDWVSIGMTYIYFNTSQPPFDDVRVRRAVSLAIDRPTWVETLLYDSGVIDNGPVPFGLMKWHIPLEELGDAGQWLEYDPDRAKDLLAEAGYPDGLKVDLTTTNAYGTTAVERAELVIDMLGLIGIEGTLQMKEYGAYLTTTFVGKFDGMAWGPQATFVDPDPYLYEMFHTDGTKNQISLSNPELDEMLEAQRAEYDYEKRKDIIYDIQKYIIDQAYRVYVPTGFGRGAYHPWVHNYGIKMGGYDYGERFMRVWVDETSPSRK